jgi:hypothetical protein
LIQHYGSFGWKLGRIGAVALRAASRYYQAMANTSSHEKRILKLARAICETGNRNGWFYIACELQTQGEPLAKNILEREPYRSEFDNRCAAVRQRMWGAKSS